MFLLRICFCLTPQYYGRQLGYLSSTLHQTLINQSFRYVLTNYSFYSASLSFEPFTIIFRYFLIFLNFSTKHLVNLSIVILEVLICFFKPAPHIFTHHTLRISNIYLDPPFLCENFFALYIVFHGSQV